MCAYEGHQPRQHPQSQPPSQDTHLQGCLKVVHVQHLRVVLHKLVYRDARQQRLQPHSSSSNFVQVVIQQQCQPVAHQRTRIGLLGGGQHKQQRWQQQQGQLVSVAWEGTRAVPIAARVPEGPVPPSASDASSTCCLHQTHHPTHSLTLGKISRSRNRRAAITSTLLASSATRFGGAFTSLSARSAQHSRAQHRPTQHAHTTHVSNQLHVVSCSGGWLITLHNTLHTHLHHTHTDTHLVAG